MNVYGTLVIDVKEELKSIFTESTPCHKARKGGQDHFWHWLFESRQLAPSYSGSPITLTWVKMALCWENKCCPPSMACMCVTLEHKSGFSPSTLRTNHPNLTQDVCKSRTADELQTAVWQVRAKKNPVNWSSLAGPCQTRPFMAFSWVSPGKTEEAACNEALYLVAEGEGGSGGSLVGN